jgi:hypothetical protein
MALWRRHPVLTRLRKAYAAAGDERPANNHHRLEGRVSGSTAIETELKAAARAGAGSQSCCRQRNNWLA